MLTWQTMEDKAVVSIEGDMTIYTAAEQKADLMAMIAHPEGLEVNLGKVTDIDSAGIQLLLMLRRERLAKGRALSLVEHSATVLSALESMGLVSYFGDPVIVSRN